MCTCFDIHTDMLNDIHNCLKPTFVSHHYFWVYKEKAEATICFCKGRTLSYSLGSGDIFPLLQALCVGGLRLIFRVLKWIATSLTLNVFLLQIQYHKQQRWVLGDYIFYNLVFQLELNWHGEGG